MTNINENFCDFANVDSCQIPQFFVFGMECREITQQ